MLFNDLGYGTVCVACLRRFAPGRMAACWMKELHNCCWCCRCQLCVGALIENYLKEHTVLSELPETALIAINDFLADWPAMNVAMRVPNPV